MTIEERWSTAIHEAGHVIVGWDGSAFSCWRHGESRLPPASSIERATERARPELNSPANALIYGKSEARQSTMNG